ncbi:ligand-gated sodium channel [Desmophyllum pertusum]|uniref:Ligand-gated sodium channel n=1 Tax=Desmophyllum pertusum TaxID=174260 RepID=A0A9W9YK99_9CNID|nr:ligand-gated sodium channel [Desmophyllum pertusum]
MDDYGESQKISHSFNTGPAGAGARVVIHDQGQMPFPDNEGHDVLPSRSTSLAIRRTVIERVDPFGNGSCISEDDVEDNIYAKKFNATYSRQACLNSCHANKQILECGCAEAQFPADADICDIQNSTTAKCLNTLLRKLLSGELNCEVHCPTPCREVIFGTSLSMGEWPSYGYEEILERRVQEREGELHPSKNIFERLNFERVVENVSYKGVNLVADIGGQLGLWIGISVLTCCELLELILLMIRNTFRKMFPANVVHVKPAPP